MKAQEPLLTKNPATLPTPVRRGQFFMVVAAIVCGIGGGLGAVGLHRLIHLSQWLFFDAHDSFLTAVESAPAWRRVAMPAIGGLIVAPIVYFFAREAKGHGVPEVMKAILIRGGAIRPRVVAVKAVTAAITIGSGGSAGREGPIVQIGAALGSAFGQALRVSTIQLRTLVACGAAAGIAAAFNAPIAGALFAVEVLLGDFGVPQFSPIVIASVVATVISRLMLGDSPAFEVPHHELVSPFELLPYMLVGIVAGLVAITFIRVLDRLETIFDDAPLPPEVLKAGVGGIAVGIIGLWFPQVFGSGSETIHAALTGSLAPALLGALLLTKIAATSITLASGGSGGVFAPSLFLGAMTGGFLGTWIHQLFPSYTAPSGAYALVTMGAVVAATTHAPITAIIIIFELTGDYLIIPPLMAGCVVSTLVAARIHEDSIYTIKLRAAGIDIGKQDDPNVMRSLCVRDVIDREPETISASAKFNEVLDLVLASHHNEFFVLNGDEELIGAVSLPEVRRLVVDSEDLAKIAVAGDVLDANRPTVRLGDSLDIVMRLFSHGDFDGIAVVDDENPRKLIGIVRQRDVIHARNEAILERDLAGSVSTTIGVAGRVRQVDVGDGYVIQEIPAPHSFIGQTIRRLAIRPRFEVQVIFVRTRRDGDGTHHLDVPHPDTEIREGDALIVAGTKESADNLASSV